MPQLDDEPNVEASGSSAVRVLVYVARLMAVAHGQFGVVRRSIRKMDKNDGQPISFFSTRVAGHASGARFRGLGKLRQNAYVECFNWTVRHGYFEINEYLGQLRRP